MPRRDDVEVIDADDIPYAPDAVPRDPRASIQPLPRGSLARLLRSVLLLYAAWVWVWLIGQYWPTAEKTASVLDLLRHLPTPPPF